MRLTSTARAHRQRARHHLPQGARFGVDPHLARGEEVFLCELAKGDDVGPTAFNN